MAHDHSEFIDYPEPEPIICPDCGGTGCHPYMQAACKRCNGSGEIGDDCYDPRYKITRYRATSAHNHNSVF